MVEIILFSNWYGKGKFVCTFWQTHWRTLGNFKILGKLFTTKHILNFLEKRKTVYNSDTLWIDILNLKLSRSAFYWGGLFCICAFCWRNSNFLIFIFFVNNRLIFINKSILFCLKTPFTFAWTNLKSGD